MRVIITKDYDEMSVWAANYVAKKIIDFKPTAENPFVLGCPTGSSPLGLYQHLVKLNKKGVLSFQNVVTFNMDEYVNLDVNHPESYHSFMWNNFFSHIDIKKENVHILDGNAKDLKAECEHYEEMIAAAGGVDLFMGGVGPDGHIAFNEPGSSLASRTVTKVPKQALTVGVGTVMDAREVLILCNGPKKARALHHMIENGVNHMWTSSMLQMHPHAVVVCDEEASVELKMSTYDYFKDKQRIEGSIEEFVNLYK